MFYSGKKQGDVTSDCACYNFIQAYTHSALLGTLTWQHIFAISTQPSPLFYPYAQQIERVPPALVGWCITLIVAKLYSRQ
jgi:hypothetical protein